MSDAVALVGSETLMGRELRDLLLPTSLGSDLRLIASSEEAGGILSEQGGEPAVLTRLEKRSLEDAGVVILAGDVQASRAALKLVPDACIVDLTHAFEDDPRARLRAPMVEPHDFRADPDAIHSIAHPAAIALALVFRQLQMNDDLESWVVHVFEPASERGAPGIQELQEQTVSLLSFKPMPKKVFDNQLSFTLLARLGEEAPTPLNEVETRIEHHLATLLQNASEAPMPSLRLVQAPVFHGYSFSIWARFSSTPDPEELERRLKTSDISVHESELEPPNNVGIAGQDGIAAGAINRDRNDPHALWLWVVADNLRLAAQNAVLVAREIL